jgi:hypothetical protein
MDAVEIVARMIDPAAFTENANENIDWCIRHGYSCERDYVDWQNHTYLGERFAQRQREARRLAEKIEDVFIQNEYRPE